MIHSTSHDTQTVSISNSRTPFNTRTAQRKVVMLLTRSERKTAVYLLNKRDGERVLRSKQQMNRRESHWDIIELKVVVEDRKKERREGAETTHTMNRRNKECTNTNPTDQSYDALFPLSPLSFLSH